jgi:hypothetical protein
MRPPNAVPNPGAWNDVALSESGTYNGVVEVLLPPIFLSPSFCPNSPRPHRFNRPPPFDVLYVPFHFSDPIGRRNPLLIHLQTLPQKTMCRRSVASRHGCVATCREPVATCRQVSRTCRDVSQPVAHPSRATTFRVRSKSLRHTNRTTFQPPKTPRHFNHFSRQPQKPPPLPHSRRSAARSMPPVCQRPSGLACNLLIAIPSSRLSAVADAT